ncbi:MAG: hypothetical protein H7A45_06875 [Verrucomicrobiales bacterium]|nr:hypothetical protein [Verrucomicrobiales bacterium]
MDRWDRNGIKFILGLDAHQKVVGLAEGLSAKAWKPLERLPKCEIKTEPRRKPERVKEGIVRQKGYENIQLVGEDVSEIRYRPPRATRSTGDLEQMTKADWALESLVEEAAGPWFRRFSAVTIQ